MSTTIHKKSNLAQSYEEAFKEHMKNHQQRTEKAGIPIIKEQQLDRRDRTQEFYKTFERQFRNSIIMKLGFKIAALQIEEEDLALYCFSLLQAEAKFPIKIFTINHGENEVLLDPEDPEENNRKDLWMETHIMVATVLTSSKEQHLFQTKIYTFFKDFLLNLLRNFMKERINWDYMVSKDYTDEKVIGEFQKVVIAPANEYFVKEFNGN